MIDKFKAKFEEGGEKRFKYTFPALVMAYCRYCDRMNDRGVQIDYYPILSTLQNIIEQIVEIIPEIALNLNL